MTKDYIVYNCKTCGRTFILLGAEQSHTEDYLTCPYHGKHKNITVSGSYDSLEDCMKARKYRKVDGRWRQDG